MSNLTGKELKIIKDADFFKVKRKVTEKIERQLAMLGESIHNVLLEYKEVLPAEVVKNRPKISGGESYMDLPWLMLDYPRIFKGGNIFAFRSMFWWGNYFSFTIHISGEPLELLRQQLVRHINLLGKKAFYICINDDPWHHHFDKSNYILLDNLPKKKLTGIIKDKHFIKLSRKLPLAEYEKIYGYGLDTYKLFLETIT